MKLRRLVPLVLVWLVVANATAQEVSEAFRKVRDSVVVVRTTQKEMAPWPGGTPVSVSGVGSGVIVAPEGLVLTAAHVVQIAERVEVELADGKVLAAKIIASEPSADLALLELERAPVGAAVAKLGDSGKVEVGDPVFIVGAPFGISHSLTVGHVSARRRANTVFGGLMAAEMFQTDAAINQGNSGGPMFDMQGEVIGIVSSILSHSGGFEGLGFVVTSNTAKQLIEARTPWSGLEGYLLIDDLARVFNLPQPAGLLVQSIVENSPADRMGLHAGHLRAEIEGEPLILGGDIVLEVQGIAISDAGAIERIRDTLRRMIPGEELTLGILRGGKHLELKSAPYR